MIQDVQRTAPRIVLGGCLLLTVFCRAGLGSEPPKLPDQIVRMLQLVQFDVTGGRLISFPQRIGHRTNQVLEDAGIRHELQIDSRAPTSSVTYKATAPHFELSITADEGDHFFIEWQPTGEPPADAHPIEALRFEQTSGKPLSLTYGNNEARKTVLAVSIWHLVLAEPEVFREELVPLLQMLRPNWDLIAVSDEIELILLQQVKVNRVNQQEHWSRLVDDLADERFAVREAADRHLREVGPAVLPLLRRMDSRQLDAEQRFRIRRIIAPLMAVDSTDSADTVVPWLASDPAAWFALLKREDVKIRHTATEQLELLLGYQLEFDPDADEPTRRNQIDKLRGSIPGSEL